MGPEYDGIVPHVSRHKSASTLRMLSIIGWIIGPSLLLSVHLYSRLPECCFMYSWIIIVSHHTNRIYSQAQYITSQKKGHILSQKFSSRLLQRNNFAVTKWGKELQKWKPQDLPSYCLIMLPYPITKVNGKLLSFHKIREKTRESTS